MPFLGEQRGGLLLGRAMDALMRDVMQPFADMGIGGGGIEHQASAVECGRQWGHEAALEVAVEALDFAFGTRPKRSANARSKIVGVGQIQQRGMPAVLAFAIGIAFEDDGSRIIEQELLRNATEKHEGLANTGEPCLAVLALTEAHVGGAALAERGDKCLESEPPASDGGEVDLHLMAWWGLEANNGIIALRLERTHIGLELGNAAVIAELLQFA